MASKIVFSADDAALREPVKRSTAEIRGMKQALREAQQQARETFREQKLQAQAAGAGTEELRKISQQYARERLAISNTSTELATKYVAGAKSELAAEEAKRLGIDTTTESLKRQRAEIEKLAVASSHGHEVTRQQQASAILRGGGLRAGEVFAGSLPGFEAIATIAFPIAGAAALLGELSKIVTAWKEVREKALEAGQGMREAYEDSHAKAQVTIDDLTVQADKIQDNIDKLAGHPNNGLKTALDEARQYADKLRDSLTADRKELAELLKEHSVGTFASLLSGVAATGRQEKEIGVDHKALESRIAELNMQFNSDAASAKTLDQIKAAGKKRDQAIREAISGTISTYRSEAKRLRDEQAQSEESAAQSQSLADRGVRVGGTGYAVNNNAKIANVEVAAGRYQDLLNIYSAQGNVAALAERENALKAQKEREEIAKQGSSKAAEAVRRAAEEQRKQWEDLSAVFQSSGTKTIQEQVTFWNDLRASTVMGSENWLVADKKVAELMKGANGEQQKLVDERIKMREEFRAIGMRDVLGATVPVSNENARGLLDAARTAEELKRAREDAALSVAQSGVQFDLQAGRISRADAALQLQTLHTMQYEQSLRRLREQLGAVRPGPESEAQRNTIQRQMTDLDARRAVEVMQDQAAVAATSWRDALKQANADWVQDSQDSARQVVALYQQALGGFNSNIVQAMMGQRTDFAGVFRGIGSSVGQIGLQKAESAVLGQFGMTKADGSKANPFAVYVVNGPGGASTGILGSGSVGVNLGQARAEADKGVFSTIGGMISSAGMSLIPGGSVLSGIFGGGRAVGGGVRMGTTYLVGENGPELFSPGATGYITPNERLTSALSAGARGGDIHVDARGSTDPAQVRVQAYRGSYEGYAAAARKQGDAQQDMRRRKPATTR